MPISKRAVPTNGQLSLPGYCSPGTILDRISILYMKMANFRNMDQLHIVEKELEVLTSTWTGAGYPSWKEVPEYSDIADITSWLWELENQSRVHEIRQDFGARFRATIRTIQMLNAYRAALRARLDASFAIKGHTMIVETLVGVDAFLDGVAILGVKAKLETSEAMRESAKLQMMSWQMLWAKLGLPEAFNTADYELLLLANERLWNIKDLLDEAETVKCFDDAYVQSGRALYITNDCRVQVKRRLAFTYNSYTWDEKDYLGYSLPKDWDPSRLQWEGVA